MNDINEVIKTRRSIRKFTDEEISNEDIKKVVESALYAPTACNSQCFHFIAVKSKEIIEEIALETEKGVEEFFADTQDEEFIARRKKQTTFFRKAPAVIFAYLTPMKYHEQSSIDYYQSKGYNIKQMNKKLGDYDIVSMGTAIENILLTIHSMGMGACMMSDPIVSEEKISKYFKVDETYRLISVIPFGKSEYIPRPLASKSLDDILEIK